MRASPLCYVAAAVIAAAVALGAPAWIVIAVAATVAVAHGWHGRAAAGPPRGPWLLLLVADALWTVGFVAFHRERGPSLTDGLAIAHVLAVLCLAVAIAWLAWRAGGRDILPILDALLMAIGLGAVVAQFVVPPLLGGGLAAWHVGLSAMAFAALSAAVLYLALVRVRMVASFRLLVGAAGLLLATDTLGQLPGPDGPPVVPGPVALGVHVVVILTLGLAVRLRPVDLTVRPGPQHQSGLGRIAALTLTSMVGAAVIMSGLVVGGPLDLWQALVIAGAMIGLVMTRTSVVVRRLHAQTRRLADLVQTDPVTGLANRGRLARQIEAAGTTRGAVVLLDVDRFTELRDALGSRAADALLREVARRALGAAGPEATVARIGSAVFGVLLPEVGTVEDAIGRASAIRHACAPPMTLDGFTLEVDVAAGFALVGADGTGADELLERADLALAVATLQPGGVAAYGRQVDEARSASPVLIAELPGALRRGELAVHFQPQVRIAGGRVFALEALVRWQHPTRGLLPPAAFIPAAERTGLVTAVTRFVLDRALMRCAEWHAAGEHVAVAVNLSVRDLLDPGLVDTVRHALDAHRLPAAVLELEVTETTAMVDPRRAVATMSALAELGVTLSVDDFGTGHSSLAYLQRLPVRRLKIDRSFVSGMLADEASRAIVASTLDLARRLGLETVAEGVEDLATLDALREMSCDAAQGYGLSRPVPYGDVLPVIRALDRTVPQQASGHGQPGLCLCAGVSP
ncbi:bifunctional diguanylate cyclase/phosphodiesterase [Actinotalea sp. M2MS4P-6]|uniref:putative bifunctional diguanylate cyclase/phosphodiesterase n=1 Tax=Actinotalea sp. M2MS4P-6 TaxID=2983762 RepID=UPI0021E510A2|nr:bifunctional diguanylate cyclase/phosphodiesterase [Actinotalea sp. M2MS4P-6]MCV2395866.1 bifunctional diguanylate cyclase/phosphodiesterase [Actinotalea sp. M2MS4P-6]